MKIQKVDNNTTFGLNTYTHSKIAKKLVEEEYPKLQKYIPILKYAVEKPDFDELGFHSNTHFYYPVESFLKFRESFFDLDGLHNARAKYNEHIDKFFAASKYFRFGEMMEEAGRAKHFLDDMSVGLHVQRGNIFQKWRDKNMHRDFETYIYDNEDSLISNAKKSSVNYKTDDFDDIFMSVVNYSKNSEFPNNSNKNNWHEIAQNTINVAIDSSRVFFDKILEYLP